MTGLPPGPGRKIAHPAPGRSPVPMLDWDRPPHNRWAFQHVREILPTAEVWRGAGPVSHLPRNHRRLDDIGFQSTAGEITVAQWLDRSYTDGFIVLHKGAIVTERYFNGMTERTLHLSQSMSKSFVGLLAGIFAADGSVDTAAPVTLYLPELGATAYAGATLQQVLDMSSGVAYSEEYTDRYSDVGQTDVASGWKPVPDRDDRKWPRSMWEQVLGLTRFEANHGERFHYRSVETDVVAFVLERVSGRRLQDLVSQHIWQPLGVEESACFTVDAAGYALGCGGLNATLRDYARFAQMVAWNGHFNGRQIVPEAWIHETRRANPDFFGPEDRARMPFGSYHNQFWIGDYRQPGLDCHGVFGQWIHTDPEADLAIVKLSTWPDFIDDRQSYDAVLAAGAIKRELSQ